MPYTPNADNAAQPLNQEYASTAAAEFRALKEKVNLFFLATSFNADENTLHTDKGLVIFNVGGVNSAANPTLQGLLSYASRSIGGGSTLGINVTAALDGTADTDDAASVQGALIQAWARTDARAHSLIGVNTNVIQMNHEGQNELIGHQIYFFNRPAADATVTGGIGADKYNHHSVGLLLKSQPRGSDGAKCGWSRGIRFEDFSLDADDSEPIPQAIDFTGIGNSDAPVLPVAFHFNALSLKDGPFTNLGAIAMPTVVAKIIPILINNVAIYGIPICTIDDFSIIP